VRGRWVLALAVLRRRTGFFKVHRAKTEALIAGAPVEEVIEVEDAWVRGDISWREAVRRLEELAARSRQAGRSG